MTQEYYMKHAKSFIDDTFYADMKLQYDFFLKHMPDSGSVLDLGSGSGRDSLFFQSLGYNVTAVDPVEEFTNNAKSLGIKNVVLSTVQDMDFENEFNGIWACASLLHVPTDELNLAFKNCSKALKKNGILYVSFKYGSFEGKRNDRYYVDLTEASIMRYLKDTNLEVVEITLSNDVRKGKSDKWFNAILMKN